VSLRSFDNNPRLIATLQRWVKQIEPLERLQARD
jgi:hypothetical protein